MHDAMLLTLYAHRNNPIFLPRFRLRHLHLVVPPYHPQGPRPALSLSLTRPRLFISIYFDHRIPHLYPSASSRPVTTNGPRSIFYYRSKWFRVVDVQTSWFRCWIQQLNSCDYNRKIISSFKWKMLTSSEFMNRESKWLYFSYEEKKFARLIKTI